MSAPLRERTMAMRGAVGDRRVPDARGRAGGRDDARRSYEEFIFERRPARLGRRGRADARGIAAVFDAADEVRIVGDRHRPDALARRPARSGRRRPRQHAGRRGLLLAGRGLGRGRGRRSREFPAVYYGHEVVGVRFVFERGRDRRCVGVERRGVPAPHARHRRRAHGGSASSGSAATRASSAS